MEYCVVRQSCESFDYLLSTNIDIEMTLILPEGLAYADE